MEEWKFLHGITNIFTHISKRKVIMHMNTALQPNVLIIDLIAKKKGKKWNLYNLQVYFLDIGPPYSSRLNNLDH